MKRIITYGTFDCLHLGHIRILRRAKDLGDELYVGLSSERFNKIKGKNTAFNYKERKELLEISKIPDYVFKEDNWGQKENDIKKYKIDVLVMGDDWEGEFDDLPCETKYFKRTPLISTSKIKKRCVNL